MRTLEKDPGRRFQQASQIKTACESLDNVEVQNAPQRVETKVKSLPFCPPLPVTIEDIYASLASGYGLMRGFDSHLELEYEIRDAVVSHRWASSRVELPLERISSIRLVKKWIGAYIEIQADQFDAVKDIPSSQQGKFRVCFKKKDREIAEQFVWHVQKRIGAIPQETYAPSPPVKPASLNSTIARYDTNGLLGSILLLLFLGFCVLVALGITVAAIYMSAEENPSAPDGDKTPVVRQAEMEELNKQLDSDDESGDH